MKKIEVKILNPESIDQAEKMMVCAARLTQRGHQISCLSDFMDLYEKTYQRSTVANLVKLPHPTIQKFGIINVVIVGASRRFLAQITRHQNEVKYMSASLQYSDYSGASPCLRLFHPAVLQSLWNHALLSVSVWTKRLYVSEVILTVQSKS